MNRSSLLNRSALSTHPSPSAAGNIRFGRLALMPLACLAANLFPAAQAVTGAEYRHLAESAVAHRQYGLAAQYYQQEADIYRRRGDVNGAAVEEAKADRWSTDLRLFIDAAPDRRTLLAGYTGAKFEPVYGCYLGAYVANDDHLGGSRYEGNIMYAERADRLASLLDKSLATSWDYCEYGSPFPTNWARELCRRGIAPHIALEPNRGLSSVQNNEYLRRFAQDARRCGGPVFLRFAGEMNGDWTAYHSNPALYRRKFRLVHDVMAEWAPNVAMIWCVNSVPTYNIQDYYPGDDAVDWVGVNIYSVLHHDNNPNRPALNEDPTTLLRAVYRFYASRKPIAICEFGASHRERLNPRADRAGIASTKIASLLADLPREFPRVKLVGFFDCDNLTARNIMPGRALNDYSITDSRAVLSTVAHAVASDYYLPQVCETVQQDLPTWLRPLQPGMHVSGVVHLSACVRTYDLAPRLVYAVDGQPLARLSSAGAYGLDLDTGRYSPGQHLLTADVLDSTGQRAARETVPLIFVPRGSGNGDTLVLTPRRSRRSHPAARHSNRGVGAARADRIPQGSDADAMSDGGDSAANDDPGRDNPGSDNPGSDNPGSGNPGSGNPNDDPNDDPGQR